MITRLPGFLRAVLRNRRRQTNRPRFLTYTVTFGCNARCIMCDSWKLPNKDDLSLDEIEPIFAQLPRMDVVRLTGGEPFARTDFAEIAHLSERQLRPLALHVTTNGFLTDRIVRFCEDPRRRVPLDLLISIDGVGEKHNEIRGHSKAYDLCLQTVSALAPRRRELRLSLAVNQTIVDAEGIDHYRRLRDALAPWGVRNHVVMAYDVSATYHLERQLDVAPRQIGAFTTFGEFTPADLQRLLREVEEDLVRYPLLQRWAKRYYIRGIRERLLGGTVSLNPPCVALNSHLRIFPNGDVPTCQFNSHVVGNLRRQTFAEVWSSAVAGQQRDWVRKCPGCWAECEVLPSAVYTLDLLRGSLGRRGPLTRPSTEVSAPDGAAPSVLSGAASTNEDPFAAATPLPKPVTWRATLPPAAIPSVARTDAHLSNPVSLR
jgi:MoaA/NifB/PqqE/SkfB family radical SAM enzyme